METVSCNLCGCDESTLLYELSDYMFERPEVTSTLVRCRECGLVYQNPRPTLEEISAHYLPEYELYQKAEADSKPGLTARLMQRAYHYGMQKRANTVTRYKSGGKWLDVGCAAGYFLNSLKRFPGWELYGVEISPEAAQIARKQYGLAVTVGTLEQAAYPDQYFDAITLWDVLEHLHSPASSLLEIRRVLKPDGILVLRVPNLDSWDASLFGHYWAGFEPPRHLYVFTPKTLSQLLQKGGFQVQRISTNIGNYPTFLLSARFWMYGSGMSKPRRAAILRALHHPVARLISSPFFYGSSVLGKGPQMVVSAAPIHSTGD